MTGQALTRLRHRLLARFPEGYAALPGRWECRTEPDRLLIGLLSDRVVYAPGFFDLPQSRQLYLLAHLAGHGLLGQQPWASAPASARQVAEDMQVTALLDSLGWAAPAGCPSVDHVRCDLPTAVLARRLTNQAIADYPPLDTHGLAQADTPPEPAEGVAPGGQDTDEDASDQPSDAEQAAEGALSEQTPDADQRPAAGRTHPGRVQGQPESPGQAGQVPWWSWLARWLRFRSPRDYRFDRPGRREAAPFILPSLGGREAWLMVAVDISGSIPPEVVQQFLEEVERLRCHVPARLRLLLADNHVHRDEELPMGRILTLPPFQGGGGTDFRPVFEKFAQDRRQELLIYFTDLRGDLPARPPDRPVLWLRAGSDLKPPFGQVIDWA
ncbi:MAG: VWA-like domain-containing protein [Halothiobacillaceae bacterium]